MAAPLVLSKGEFLRRYRRAFDDNQRGIESILRKGDYFRLLRTYLAINEDEESTVKQARREERPTEAFRIVREKDTLESYVGFSRVLMEIDRAAAIEVFPFVCHLRDGHAPLPKRSQHQERVQSIKLREDAAVFVWLVASQRDEEAACQVLQDNYREGTVSVPVRFKGLQIKVFSFTDEYSLLSPIQICLVAPRQQFPDARTIATLLRSIQPRVNYAVLSGTCVANEGRAALGDVVMVTTKAEWPVVPELQHVTELWALKEEAWHEDPIASGRHPVRSRSEEELVLARVYAELKTPEDQRSKWFESLQWVQGTPLTENPVLQQIAPNSNEVLTGENWTQVQGDILAYRPSESLLAQAKASMLYAPATFPLPCSASRPEVVFGRVANYTNGEDKVACSHEAFSFYAGAREVSSLKCYLAAMGVCRVADGHDEPEYREYGSHLSAVYIRRVLDYLSTKLQYKE